MIKYLYSLFLPLIMVTIVFSCSKQQAEKDESLVNINRVGVEKAGLNIKNISVANREKWQLFIGSKIYKSNAIGQDSIMAVANIDSFYFEYSTDISSPRNLPLFMYYSSTQYCNQFGPIYLEGTGPRFVPPNIIDQTSLTDLIAADLLWGKYYGPVLKTISNSSLVHANALLEFTAHGLKNDDAILIKDLNKQFLPYHVKDSYKAIVTGNWIGAEKGSAYGIPPIIIEVRSKNIKIFELVVRDFYPIKSNTKYTFKLIVDYETAKITMIDTASTPWNSEPFPLTP